MLSGSLPYARPNAANTRCVVEVKQVGESDVVSFVKPNLQLSYETAHGKPKIVPDHHDALDSTPIALPQGLH